MSDQEMSPGEDLVALPTTYEDPTFATFEDGLADNSVRDMGANFEDDDSFAAPQKQKRDIGTVANNLWYDFTKSGVWGFVLLVGIMALGGGIILGGYLLVKKFAKKKDAFY